MTKPASTPGKRPKTLVFHIGDHKTGSTSIQYAFAANRVCLQNRSIFYPAELTNNGLYPHFIAYATGEKGAERDRAIKIFRDLGQKLQRSDADFCLISAETFELVDPAVFREVLETYWTTGKEDVRIIGYVRPHATRMTSMFAERVKIGAARFLSGDLSSAAKVMRHEGRWPYLPRFSAWRDQFGDRFTLRPMIRDRLRENDVVRDFIHHAFDGVPFELTGGDQANESLDLTDLMRLKVLQSYCSDKPAHLRHALGWEFARVVGQMPPPARRSKLSLHKELAQRIHAQYIDDARAMDREFFSGEALLEVELDKALETAIEMPQSVDPEDYLSAEEIRGLSTLSEIMASMFENKSGKWPEFFQRLRVQAVRRTGKTSSK